MATLVWLQENHGTAYVDTDFLGLGPGLTKCEISFRKSFSGKSNQFGKLHYAIFLFEAEYFFPPPHFMDFFHCPETL